MAKSGATHTYFRRGQSVYVILRDGTRFRDKFEEKQSKRVILRERGSIRKNKLRSITIAR